RVEAACFRRELAFAAKLPNAERVRELARDALTIPPATWTDTAERDRDAEGSTELLHHLGAPDWLVRILLAARAWRSSKTAARGSSKRAEARQAGRPPPGLPMRHGSDCHDDPSDPWRISAAAGVAGLARNAPISKSVMV